MPEEVTSLTIKILSQDVATANERLKKLETQGDRSERSVEKLGRSSKLAFGTIAAGVGSVLSVSAVTGAAVKEWLNYDKAMKEVQSVTTSSRAEFNAMRSDVSELASTLGVDATLAARGLYQALSAGVPKENAIEFMTVASKSAIAGVTEVKVAVDGLTNVINAYKLPVSEAEAVSDKLFAAVVNGKTTFEELSSNMSKASVIAASMEVPFEQLLASIVSITKQGTPTSEAFTQVKAALQALLDPSDQMQAAFNQMGVASGKQAIAQHGLAGTLQLVRDAYAGNDAALVKAMRSVEAYNGALSVTGVNLAGYVDGLEKVTNSAGNTQKAFKDNANTLENAFTSLKMTFIGFVEQLEQSFGAIQNTSDFLKELAGNLRDVTSAQSNALQSATAIGGTAGAQALQQEIALLEKRKEMMEANGASLERLNRESQEPGFGIKRWTSNETAYDVKLEGVDKQLRAAKAALAEFDQEVVASANLLSELARAHEAKDTAAIAGLEAQFDAQQKANEEAAKQAEVLKEAGELEILLKEEKVKIAAEQIKKDAESAKLQEETAKKEEAALERLKEEAERLATTDRERLELKIKQLETLKLQGPEEAKVAEEAIQAVRDQIAAYDDLQDKRNSKINTGIPILGDALNLEEGLIRDSYSRRKEQMVRDTKETADMIVETMSDAQARVATSMVQGMLGNQQFTLDAYSDFFGNLSQLSSFHSEKAFKVAQAASIAQATIKMFESAVAAYAQGSAISPFLGPVFASAALAAGAANIASIKSQTFQAYEHGGMIPSGAVGLVGEAGPEIIRGPAVVTSARATRGLQEGAGERSKPIQVIVNNAPGYTAEVTESEDDKSKMVEITIRKTIDRLTNEANTGGGKFVPALAKKFNLNRNGSTR